MRGMNQISFFSFCLGNQWHFDLLKCGQKWWMFSYFRMLTRSERHNSAVTVLLRATETPFCWRECLCLFSFLQPCISLNESLCVFIFSAFRGLCLEGFIVLGHMMYCCRKACIKSIGCCLCACSLRLLEGVCEKASSIFHNDCFFQRIMQLPRQ